MKIIRLYADEDIVFNVGADTHDLTMFIVSKLIGMILIGIAWFVSLVEVEEK